MELIIDAKLILRQGRRGIRPIVRVDIDGEEFVLHISTDYAEGYGPLVEKIATTFGGTHPQHSAEEAMECVCGYCGLEKPACVATVDHDGDPVMVCVECRTE